MLAAPSSATVLAVRITLAGLRRIGSRFCTVYSTPLTLTANCSVMRAVLPASLCMDAPSRVGSTGVLYVPIGIEYTGRYKIRRSLRKAHERRKGTPPQLRPRDRARPCDRGVLAPRLPRRVAGRVD